MFRPVWAFRAFREVEQVAKKWKGPRTRRYRKRYTIALGRNELGEEVYCNGKKSDVKRREVQ